MRIETITADGGPSVAYFRTRGVQVFRLGVAVCGVADGGFVGVRGELVIQLLGAVDENGHALHLGTTEENQHRSFRSLNTVKILHSTQIF